MLLTQLADSSDDAARRPSAPIEKVQNQSVRLIAAMGNPSQARDESDSHYSIECIPSARA